MRRALAVTVVTAVLLASGVAARAVGLDQDRADAIAELQTLS